MKSLYLLLCAITFAAQADVHTVTFRRLNGTVLSRVEVEHGGSVAAPAAPAESGFTFSAWDGAAKLANVTNDVTCWALYEAETAKSPSTSISSQSVAVRETPYSLDEYFQLYDNLAWSDEFSGTSLSAGSGKNWQINTDKDGQDQLQTYTTSGNVTVSDGTLKLTCKRESSTRITFGSRTRATSARRTRTRSTYSTARHSSPRTARTTSSPARPSTSTAGRAHSRRPASTAATPRSCSTRRPV